MVSKNTQKCPITCLKMRDFAPKRVNFHKKGGVMRYLSILFLLFAAVFAANALSGVHSCAYVCKCECGHHYCDWCGKCANEHHRDCECECHKDVGLYWDDVNKACKSGCDSCEQYHQGLEIQHEIWLSYQKQQKHQGKRSVHPQQKKTTPRQPQHSSGRSATR